jgi:WD40 repeat protein
MRKEYFSLTLLIAFLVFGCGAPPLPPSLPVETPTLASPMLTSTSQPTATEVPPTATVRPPTLTLTPETGLQTNGPYFAYLQVSNLILRLVFVDADGRGRKVIQLPKAINDSYAHGTLPAPDIRFVSPDGHWLAFYTGSAGEYGQMPAHGTADLTLNLLDLETGETQVITPLLSKDYPNNFAQAAKNLNDPDRTAESLYDAFTSGITRTLAWSPDSRYLAFAGQMDGLSSDLYVYEVGTKSIRRLSSGDQELQWISWSPDGKWIVHSGVFGVGAGMTFDIYVAALDGLSVPHISTSVLYDGIENWLNDHQYFENDGENGPGSYGLRLVDVATGNITKIWAGSFYSYAVDKNGLWAAVLASSPDVPPNYENGYFVYDFDSDFVPAIYLINLKTLEKKRVDFPDTTHTYGPVASSGFSSPEFVIGGGLRNANVMLLSADGTWTQTDLGDASILVSPNSEYWLAITTVMSLTNQNGLVITDQYAEIYSKENTLIEHIPLYSLEKTIMNYVTWRPDSSGVFLISGSEIYSMNIPDGDIRSIETNLLTGQGLTYTWINGQ